MPSSDAAYLSPKKTATFRVPPLRRAAVIAVAILALSACDSLQPQTSANGDPNAPLATIPVTAEKLAAPVALAPELTGGASTALPPAAAAKPARPAKPTTIAGSSSGATKTAAATAATHLAASASTTPPAATAVRPTAAAASAAAAPDAPRPPRPILTASAIAAPPPTARAALAKPKLAAGPAAAPPTLLKPTLVSATVTAPAGGQTVCPAGTIGMWSKDVIEAPVYICRTLHAQQ